MVKSDDLINRLIKRKNLIAFIKKNNINNVNQEAIAILENYLGETIKKIIPLLKEEMIVQGRKTLKKQDVLSVLDKIKTKNEFKNWEI